MELEDSNLDPTRSPNWPHPRDLTFESEKTLFRKYAVGRKTLVEIGVFEGASAACFRGAMPPEATLHLIDPFIPDSMNSRLVARTQYTYSNVESVENGRVVWYRDYSYNVVMNWKGPIDLLFIDGDHREQACQKDWDDWHPFISMGE